MSDPTMEERPDPRLRVPVALAELSLDRFRPLVGSAFTFRRGSGDLALSLFEVSPLSDATSPPGAFRTPYRLIFHGPPTPVVPQGIAPLDNGTLGRIEIFLVPIGPAVAQEGRRAVMQYEAIFT